MPTPGLVSIVLPTYNGVTRIRRAVDSVLAQTYGAWELQIVLDGTPDDTASVLSEFGDARLHVTVLPANAGVSAARNAAIERAQGEFVAFLDDDDLWLPRKLERQVELLRSDPDLGIVHGGVLDVMPDGRRLKRMPFRGANSYRENLVRDSLALSSVVVRRSTLDRVGVFDLSLRSFEDWDLWTRILRIYRADYVRDIVAVVEQRPGSLMHRAPATLARDRAYVIRRRWQMIKRHRLQKRVLAYHDFFVAGLLLVTARHHDARRRALRSLRLRPSPRAALVYAISFTSAGPAQRGWRLLQRARRTLRV